MSLTRADKIAEITKREALAAAFRKSAASLREELQAEALAEFETNGTAASWTIRDVGRATLPLSQQAVVIADPDALAKWTKDRHPEHLETVEQVRSAYQTYLLQNAQPHPDGVVLDPITDEVIPGLAVRAGNVPGTLTIVPERGVKAVLAGWAEREVARLLAAENGPVSDAD
ncbi:MAG TPA: hypothetical protein VHA75_02800 [Rugosimonospora sp.]|nr:hypothetical protein [Rugosimonospora sp.]